MDIGMLWFDDGQGSVKDKVNRAAEFYSGKYGRAATVCMVHPKTLAGWEGRVGGIEVLAERAVLPNHFWIGIEEAPNGEAASANGKNGHAPGRRSRGRAGRRNGRKQASRSARSDGRAASSGDGTEDA